MTWPKAADPMGEAPDTKRLKILISAYACEPGEGSEPGVGWNVAVEAARRHEVWVITRANNRRVIEAELARNPIPTLQMVYHDLPRWTRWWKRGARGTRLYYYLWQLALYPVIRRLDRKIRFDVTHHVTFVNYWMPSLLPAPTGTAGNRLRSRSGSTVAGVEGFMRCCVASRGGAVR